MSGTGKSSVLRELARRGHRVVDTDSDEWCHWVSASDGEDWIWREDRIAALLALHTDGALFVSGCKSNQGRFYPDFDAVVLLSAPAEVILGRVASRDDNPYGKRPEERHEILGYLETVEPLLRATATAEIDASRPLSEVADALETIGTGIHRSGERGESHSRLLP